MFEDKKIKRNRELTFLIVAVLMLIILAVSVSYLLEFLIKRLNIVLNPNVIQAPAVTQFNIEEFDKLGLIKSSQ